MADGTVRTVAPEELLTAAVIPGLEHFFEDWTRITVPESPNYRFLLGDEVPYRILMYSERGLHGLPEKVADFQRLRRDLMRGMPMVPLDVCERRPDGRLLIINGNHRAAIAHAMGIPCPINVLSIDALAFRIDRAARRSPHYQQWIAPMRRRIAGL